MASFKDQQSNYDYDVVVIGAGIQGAGVAQAAALQGWRVLLIEQYAQPAMGTSSKSSKLIHGGLRYLETAQFSLVKECLQERKILQNIAPELVKPIRFVIPIYSHSKRAPLWIRLGLWLYGLLGDAKPLTLPKQKWNLLESLKSENLKAVFSYEDAQTDDAQLTYAVVESARALGAEISFDSAVTSIEKLSPNIDGYIVTAAAKKIKARTVVNAAGPWINHVRDVAHCKLPSMEIDLVQGSHIVIDSPAKLFCYYLESPDDKRAMFVLPWQGKTMVGTTEKLHVGDPASSAPTQQEVEYLKRGFDYYFPELSDATVTESFAGLRVLGKSANDPNKRVRDTKILNEQSVADGYYAIYGGKLTGYRATAEKVVKLLARHFPNKGRLRSTKSLRL